MKKQKIMYCIEDLYHQNELYQKKIKFLENESEKWKNKYSEIRLVLDKCLQPELNSQSLKHYKMYFIKNCITHSTPNEWTTADTDLFLFDTTSYQKWIILHQILQPIDLDNISGKSMNGINKEIKMLELNIKMLELKKMKHLKSRINKYIEWEKIYINNQMKLQFNQQGK